jgi:N-methylhydantoinase B
MEIEVLTDEPYIFSGLYERTRHPAPGLQGGSPGACGHIATSNGVPLPPKISTLVPPGTVVTVELPGGGGYGPPGARDPQRVLEDVREGYVSIERARDEYGVLIDPVTWTVLAHESSERRAAREELPGTRPR